MKNIEEQLKMKKVEIDNMEVPGEIEDRLRSALNSEEKKSSGRTGKLTWLMRHKRVAAVLALLLLTGIYNYDVLAYYGKKIIGYDEVVYGSLKDLNDMGMGQEINKSYKLKNGTEVLLDGVMMDDNKLIIMYRIIGKNEEKITGFWPPKLQGTFGEYNRSGAVGYNNETLTGIKWICDFEPPSIFDKTLTFSIASSLSDESMGEIAEIKFNLNRNKAIKRTAKVKINECVESQGVKYNVSTLSATPLSIFLDGTVEFEPEDVRDFPMSAKDGVDGRIRRELRVELWETYIKDGKEVTEKIQEQGGRRGSDGTTTTFRYEFEGLKPNLTKLILKVVKTEDIRIIDKEIDINIEKRNIKVVPETEELIIKEVKKQNGNTVVVFNAEEDVDFVTALFIGDNQAEEISAHSNLLKVDGGERLEKTYTFKGNGENMKLMFKTISHQVPINKEIILYEEK